MENHWDISEFLQEGSLPETIVAPVDNAEMVLVPKGPCIIGITSEELRQVFLLEQRENPIFMTEVPAHEVILKSFYIDRYPVTNYQFRKFVEETGHRTPWIWDDPHWSRPMQPVVGVGWEDAGAYATWAGKTLPSEAQWEKAGRGDDGRWWSWGNEFSLNRCNSREQGLHRTSDIGLFEDGISPYGCYDMCGNVWEMCEGRWQETMPPMRGGCFLGTAMFVRITCRWTPEDTVDGAHWLGFRLVKEVPYEIVTESADER